MDLSIVIPAYNEAAKIGDDLKQLQAYSAGRSNRYEVIVVNDGSQDDTLKILSRWQRQWTCLRVVTYSVNRGKGYALRRGALAARYPYVVLLDAGGCVPLPLLEQGCQMLAMGYDIVVGSRYLPASCMLQPPVWYRRIGSRCFGWGVRRLFGLSGISDTQCGIKFLTRSTVRKILGEARIDGFMYDIELLVLARVMGLVVKELPVIWRTDRDSRFRPVSGMARNIRELVRIKRRTTKLWRPRVPGPVGVTGEAGADAI